MSVLGPYLHGWRPFALSEESDFSAYLSKRDHLRL